MPWASMEKQLNSSGFFRGFRAQKDLEDKNIQPESFEDQNIFMSMSNDILWKTDHENDDKVKNYAKKFLPGHWTFLGPASEERWYGDSHDQQGQWDRTAKEKRFKETGHPIFTSTSALSRGILKQKRGGSTMHFNGHTVNTELLFCAAITDWCFQFGLTNEGKERVAILVDNGILTMVEPEEVEMLASLPNLAHGNKKQEARRRELPSIGKECTDDTIM